MDGSGRPRVVADVGIQAGLIAAVGPGLKGARGDRLPRPRGVPRVHRHPQPLRREGPRRPRAAHEGPAGHHPRGLRAGRHLGGAGAPGGAGRVAAEAHRPPRGLRRRVGLVVHRRVPRAAWRRPSPRPTSRISSRTARCGNGWSGPTTARRPATRSTAMQSLLRRGLDEGACGLSTGLIYPPCCYADTDELIALGRVLAETGRPLVVHMRSESDRILEALDEMIRVARESGCPVHVSHLKVAGRENWSARGRRRGRARRRPRRRAAPHRRPVPLHRGQHAAGRDPPAVGARRRRRAHAGASSPTRRRGPVCARRCPIPPPPTGTTSGSGAARKGIVIADIPSGRHPEMLGKSLAEAREAVGQGPLRSRLRPPRSPSAWGWR